MSEEVQFSIQSTDGRYNFAIAADTVCGRDASCEAVIPETSMSRRHARFFVKDSALYVEDLGSTNGTFVNGQQLEKEAKLVRYNDIVRFDLLEFKVFVELADPQVAEAARHVVAEASDKSEARAPRSWAMNEEVGQGTVVMDLGAKKREAEEEKEEESAVDESLLQSVDQPSLIGIRGVDQGKTIALAANDESMTVWQIGRSPEMDVVVDDPSVSEHQAQIIFEQGTWKIVDVISTNATYVNGEKILTHYLSNGDKFSVGAAEYLFRVSNKTDFRPRKLESGPAPLNRVLVGGAAALVVGLFVVYMLLFA
ncbi:MAG: hypothetical protein DHS20C12_21050 [Pseudohongiella sp.]|nr:MAG: hypothetical protein DHS20C12_21050 [Pseudohongiella sp.]